MTTFDEIITFVPGAQTPWLPSTRFPEPSRFLVADLAAWRAIQDPPNYNAPLQMSEARDFAPLAGLLAAARLSAAPWVPDTEADLAEQQENAWAFHEAQMNVIMGDGD